MTAGTAYGLDTPRGVHWADLAACGPDRPVDPEWWWPEAGRLSQDGMRALHICRSHCRVRAACHADAVVSPPRHPVIQAGCRWVLKSGGGGQVVPASDPPTSAVGCPYCSGEA